MVTEEIRKHEELEGIEAESISIVTTERFNFKDSENIFPSMRVGFVLSDGTDKAIAHGTLDGRQARRLAVSIIQSAVIVEAMQVNSDAIIEHFAGREEVTSKEIMSFCADRALKRIVGDIGKKLAEEFGGKSPEEKPAEASPAESRFDGSAA